MDGINSNSSPQLVVFDIDGTLADHSHRLSIIKDYPTYENMAMLDEPKKQIILVANAMSKLIPDITIEFWTGRSIAIHDLTRDWLRQHVGEWTRECNLRMCSRHKNSRTQKTEWIVEFQPTLMFEDNERDARTFRELGVYVIQVC